MRFFLSDVPCAPNEPPDVAYLERSTPVVVGALTLDNLQTLSDVANQQYGKAIHALASSHATRRDIIGLVVDTRSTQAIREFDESLRFLAFRGIPDDVVLGVTDVR